MNTPLFRMGLGCFLLLPLANASITFSEAPFTYSQSFDALPSTDGASSVNGPWANNSTIAGWSIYAGESQVADIVSIRAGNGSDGSDRAHVSYGIAGSGERAFGFQSGSTHRHSPSHGANSISDSTPSGLVASPSQVFGSIVVAFTNQSGRPINALDFSYTGEQWRASSGSRANTLFVQWAVGDASSQPSDLVWNDITEDQAHPAGANFISPVVSSVGALDGNAPASRITNLGASLENIVWNSGKTLFIRWVDVNDPGSDHGLAIDDFILNASLASTAPGDFRGAYFENFDSLGTTGGVVPAGWSVFNGASGSSKSTWLTEINPAQVAAMVKRADTLVAATPPSGSQNRGFNAGLAASPADRMLASSPTGDAGTGFQLELTNTSGEPIHAVSLSYDIHRFSAPSTVEVMPGYQLFHSLDQGLTWTNVSALNPTRTGPDGVVVPNSVGVTHVPATSFSLPSMWASGAKLLLRWVDDNGDPSPDQVVGLDNVSVSIADLAYSGPVVPAGSVWKYLDTGTDPGAGWNGLSFDDSSWSSGGAELGYGDGDEITVISYGTDSAAKHPAYFFRHSFEVEDADSYKDLAIRLKRDDGAVIYLNGVEILRDNMPEGVITHETYTTGNTVDGANESTFFEFTVPASGLIDGRNVLAVSVHQDRPTSSDVSFDLELSLVEKPNPNVPVFASDIIALAPAVINSGITGTLADHATDANGDPLFFTKISGPEWLIIAEDGTLSGNPGAGAIGVNEFVVSVTDNKDGTATATIRIEVRDTPELARAPFPGVAGSLTFGIVPDTQGSTNGVPTAETRAVAERMIVHAPKFAIHVGDVTDGNHSGDAKMVELNYFNSLMTTPMAAAGIPLYPVRGNHDANVHTLTSGGEPVWKAAFPHLFTGDLAVVDPTNVPNGSAASPNGNNYSFVLNAAHNTFFVGLDTWQGGSSANYPSWVNAQFAAIRAEHPDAHIFAYSHSGLFASANHGPMAYAGPNTGYIAAGIEHGIDGWFSGHNHIFDRSMAVDAANGNRPAFFNMTVGSASNKFYALQRSPLANQHLSKVIDSNRFDGRPISYQIVDVDGPWVSIRTWMSPKNSSGGFSNWSVWDEYTYSTQGGRFTVAPGESYNDRAIVLTAPVSAGYDGTTVRIVDGVNNDTTSYTYGSTTIAPYRNVSVGWWQKGAWHDAGDVRIVSDIVSIHGMRDTPGRHRTDPYTLVLEYDAAALAAETANLSLVAFLDENTDDTDPGDWINAVDATLGSPATEPVLRAPSADDAVGTWGIDAENGRIWARLDYQGDFAVASSYVEEGSTTLPELITDHQSYGDVTIPAGTTVVVSETGSLEITGRLVLEDGAELVIEGGELVIAGGSRISGRFTVFNSFGSWNINGDTTFEINQTLTLISDVHVAPGAMLGIHGGGELILDGSVIDSQTPGSRFRIFAANDGLLTIARSVVSDAIIDIRTSASLVPANLKSRIYDSRFTNSLIEAGEGSAVYHNLFDSETAAGSNVNGTTAFDAIDGWSNVTDADDLVNRFTLGFAAPADATRTLDADGNLFVRPGDPVVVALEVDRLGANTITAAEALIGYNSNLLAPAGTTAATGWQVIRDVNGLDGALGLVDSVLGIGFSGPGNDGVSADSTLATVSFDALAAGQSAGFFRVQTNRVFDGTGSLFQDTRLTKSQGGIPSYLAAFTANTGDLMIDAEAPEIDALSVTAVQVQSAGPVDVLDTASRAFRSGEPVVLSFTAADAGLAGLDAADAANDLKLVATNGTTVLDAANYTVRAVEDSGVVTYTVELLVPATATVGTYAISASVIDRSGNESDTVSLGGFVIGSELLVGVELQAFTGGDREVTFTATGGTPKTWTKVVSFTGNTGVANLEDVPAGTTGISAKTAWTLRSKLPVTVSPEGFGAAQLTGSKALRAGDLNGDNVINALDYSILQYHWTTTNAVADITGDGVVNSADYHPLGHNFYTTGDPQ